jgi:ligand-binding sensor domain-containing protein
VTAVAVDQRSRKFFGSASGITWINGDTVGYLVYSDFNTSMVDAPVRQLEVFNDTLYVAQEGGIGRFVSGVDGVSGASRWTSEYGMSPLSGNILSVFVDSRGHQWFGTDMGVQEHAGQKAKENWILYTTADGLVDNHVISMAEDQEGGIWFGTLGGVSWLKEGLWTSFTTADGLPNDTVLDIGIDQEGSVWLATATGYCRYFDGTFADHYTSISTYHIPDQEMQVCYNPADRSLHLSYSLAPSTEVSARLYTMHGQLAAIWSDLPAGPGWQQVVLPLSALKSGNSGGIYVLELRGNVWIESRKLLITD